MPAFVAAAWSLLQIPAEKASSQHASPQAIRDDDLVIASDIIARLRCPGLGFRTQLPPGERERGLDLQSLCWNEGTEFREK